LSLIVPFSMRRYQRCMPIPRAAMNDIKANQSA
jgi:hypothetical protein